MKKLNKKEVLVKLFKHYPEKSATEIAKLAKTSNRYARKIKNEMIGNARESLVKAEVKVTAKKRVLVISDTHIPFEHPKALEHCKMLYEKFNCDTVVHIGDLVDFHSASRFASELEAMNVNDELEAAKKAVKPWVEAFPNVLLCLGNHDRIPVRRAKEVGMSSNFMKSFNELFDLPDTWVCAKTHEIDGVVYDHGVGSGGMYGAKNTAVKMGVSFVQGHVHTAAGVNYVSRYDGKTIFGMNCGCLCSSGSYNTNYAADYRGRVSLGAGVVIEGEYAIYVPLNDK